MNIFARSYIVMYTNLLFVFWFFYVLYALRCGAGQSKNDGGSGVVNNSFERAIKEDNLSESSTKSTTSLSITGMEYRNGGQDGSTASRPQPARPVILEFQLTRTTNQTA